MRFGKLFNQLMGNIIVVGISLILVMLIGEILMRILFYESMDFDMEMWKYAAIMKIRSNNPRIRHEHRSNCRAWLMGVEVNTNSFGLRGNETTLEKPPNTYRIIVLGDSITMGWGVPQDQTYPTQLERMFNTQPPEGFPLHLHYEILNLGIGNYNTIQEVTRLLNMGLQFDPDLILLAFFINDAEPVPQQKSGFLIKHSYLYAFVLSRLRRVPFGNTKPLTFKDYYRGLYTENQRGWQATKAALVELVDIGHEQEIPIAMFIIPELHDLSVAYPFADIHENIMATATGIGLPAVDLLTLFRNYSPEEALWVSPTDAHHNALAQSMIARGIYDALAANLIKP